MAVTKSAFASRKYFEQDLAASSHATKIPQRSLVMSQMGVRRGKAALSSG